MLKYSVTFSSNHNGSEKTEKEVKNLITTLLECAGIDGATLIKNFAGVWRGEMEDSYSLVILSDNDISLSVEGLALNIKTNLNQHSVLIEKALTDASFL